MKSAVKYRERSVTLEDVTERLQYAPISVLNKVMGYLDGLMDKEYAETVEFVLSEEQKRILEEQSNLSLSEYEDVDEFINKLKLENEL